MDKVINIIDNFPIKIDKIIISLVYILIGIVVFQVIKKIVNRKGKLPENQKLKTIKILILNIVKYIDCFLVVLAIASVFGVNVKSILAGLGIGTVIIGLAFQDFAKDIIAGISIIVENKYSVGDTIEVEGFMGEVIFLGLKSTKIKDFKGAIKIMPNRNMESLINYSLNNSLAVVDIGVSYDNKPEEVEKVLNNLFPRLKELIPSAKGDFQILGINELEESSVVYRIAIEVESMQQYIVQRTIRREIKNEFDKHNIKIPYKQIEVHNGK